MMWTGGSMALGHVAPPLQPKAFRTLTLPHEKWPIVAACPLEFETGIVGWVILRVLEHIPDLALDALERA